MLGRYSPPLATTRGDEMTYTKNGKTYSIPNDELQALQDKLKISRAIAADVWLTDRGLDENEEQMQLNKKAGTAVREKVSTKRKSPKPRTVKTSDEKKQLFSNIFSSVLEFGGNNVTILKENKLIEVKIGEKTFKIDIIEQRNKKN
jgi:hypothetical protein